ncbi:MAG: tyrosine-type recombinase/integrase [Lachnospiraceae bacterium]|nr:tyrosine-type recombinase/integrase [Lachnospiraceae bacterium]
MSRQNNLLYSPEIGAAYLEGVNVEGMTPHEAADTVRCIRVLDDMCRYGRIRKTCYSVPEADFSGDIGGKINAFLQYSKEIRRSDATIGVYKCYLYRFYDFIVDIGIDMLEDIQLDHVLDFVGTYPSMSKEGVLKTIRVMFRYWEQEGYVRNGILDSLKRIRCVKPKRLPSYFTPEEISKIESSVERSSSVGKCNYAMILLASRLGLRISDITGLEFSNINWDTNIISITTHKTKKYAEYPLLPDIGNALIDYIQGGRANSTSDRIFLSGQPPYNPLKAPTGSQRIRACIRESGVNIDGRKHGPHSLRHSFASAMLENGVKMPTISEVLAHRNTQTTMSYLRIDMKEQLKCALEVPPVEDNFYTQKDGFFYGTKNS